MIDFSKLKVPFPEKDIEWRIQSAGKTGDRTWARVLAYVTNRAIMARLDDVCGPANWKNEFKEWIGKGVLCGISIKVEGEWITKWDGAEETAIDSTKGGLSASMKRAAVQWGIGRYLYDLEAGYAVISSNGKHYQAGKSGSYESFKWDAPPLPAWALPEGTPVKPLETIDIETAIERCSTTEELLSLWDDLTEEEKVTYKESFSSKRMKIKEGKE
jgi:hypothetical protein